MKFILFIYFNFILFNIQQRKRQLQDGYKNIIHYKNSNMILDHINILCVYLPPRSVFYYLNSDIHSKALVFSLAP